LQRRIKIRANEVRIPSRRHRNGEKGVEMIELALVLPLLLLMFVGLLFYGDAWAVKDKLDGAGRDAARVAINDFNDTTNPQCAGGTPCSVQAAASAAVAALSNANIDTCGTSPSTAPPAATGTFAWTYTSGPCASSGASWTMLVERAVPQTIGGVDVLTTRITLTYPFAWNFVAVNPFGSPIMLGSQTIMTNLN
jgi:Flp pilus assembly protein TadG